ncbi:MAG: Arc family DNA binding domain-containing protein [Gemmatimonadetes bacterium]|nr:Arc family DNA binding domain-containing protein [Gemmatimonadota bacterium]
MPERKRFLLRISPKLYKELARWAADDFRSVNAQIEFLLQDAVAQRRRRRKKGKE